MLFGRKLRPMDRAKYEELLARYRQGTCTDEERALLDQWFDSLDTDVALPDADEQKRMLAKNWSALASRTVQQTPVWRLDSGWQRWAAAAVVAGLLLGMGWVIWPESSNGFVNRPRSQSVLTFINQSNSSATPQRLRLPDSSWVTLQPGSRLQYPAVFARAKREVTLTGDAFFEVQKNPTKPFLVYANDVVTKVLGTSFRVNAQSSGRNVTVSVRTGKVSVYSHKLATLTRTKTDPETIGVVLTPNQQVTYLSEELRLVKTLVEKPAVLVSPAQLATFTFQNAPVSRVFAAIEKVYGVDVVYDEDVMRHCAITTSLEEENLHEKLRILCKLLGASYKVIDAQVVISSPGCSDETTQQTSEIP